MANDFTTTASFLLHWFKDIIDLMDSVILWADVSVLDLFIAIGIIGTIIVALIPIVSNSLGRNPVTVFSRTASIVKTSANNTDKKGSE